MALRIFPASVAQAIDSTPELSGTSDTISTESEPQANNVPAMKRYYFGCSYSLTPENLVKSILALVTVLIATLSIAPGVYAQSNVDAPMTLEMASHARMVEGDLDRAISLYKQVSLSATASRSNVAKALVALGDTYALQGSAKALPTYERVISEFSDQPTSFVLASAKLTVLSAGSSAAAESGAVKAGVEYTVVSQELVMSGQDAPRRYDISPDGKKLIIVAAPTRERKNLFPQLRYETYIRDTAGSLSRPLIKDAEDWEYITQPRWSPNGKYIFYTASKYLSKPDGELQFMLLDIESQETRQLGGDYLKRVDKFRGVEWMPNSNSLIFQSQDGVRVMSLDGVEKKYFPREIGHMTWLGNVSPDGRYLLFHRVTSGKEDHDEMDIWQLDLDSGEYSEVSSEAGYEGWPAWNQDGTQIYYVSGPENARNVYRRTPGSNSAPVKVTAYSNASAVFPRISPQGGELTFALVKDNHVIFTADSNAIDRAHSVVRGAKAMLSPDGQTIYYIDKQPGREGLWKVAVNGDNPQQLASGKVLTSYTAKTLLSPDGSQIAYSQYTGDTTTLFVMPSSGGSARSLYSAGGVRHLIPSWSPNGKEIAFCIDGDLMVIPASGGDASVLASVQNWESWSLDWSPDGKAIAGFAYLEGEDSNHIMMVDRATKELTRVTPKNEGQYKEGLDWHPDGDRISYMYYNTENSNGSRIVSLETSSISDLVDMPDPNWDYIGIWGPDKRYYFLSTPRGESDWGLYAFDESDQEHQQIRQIHNRSVSLPSWSADGSRIVWSEKEAVRQIWMMTHYE